MVSPSNFQIFNIFRGNVGIWCKTGTITITTEIFPVVWVFCIRFSQCRVLYDINRIEDFAMWEERSNQGCDTGKETGKANKIGSFDFCSIECWQAFACPHAEDKQNSWNHQTWDILPEAQTLNFSNRPEDGCNKS